MKQRNGWIKISNPDMGCPEATRFLGRQSSCLECPFKHCILDMPLARQQKKMRNDEIRKLFSEGKTIDGLASLFKLHERQIRRVLNE